MAVVVLAADFTGIGVLVAGGAADEEDSSLICLSLLLRVSLGAGSVVVVVEEEEDCPSTVRRVRFIEFVMNRITK